MTTTDTPRLRSSHLLTLSLQVDYAGLLNIGATPAGRRRIAPVSGGHFTGTRLRGVILPGAADWVMARADDNFNIDVRMTLRTDDDALIYLAYRGLFKASPEALARYRRREMLAPEEYNIRTVVRFESGAASYQWLNDVLAIGAGRQTETGAVYEIFEIL
jgi:hypothetical protein